MSLDEIARAQARIGLVLHDKWTLERLLGVGGMAAVYAARHRNGARAAVKLLHPEFAAVAEVRDRFLREGYTANRVEHPGVVAVLDDDFVRDGPAAGTAFLVMELLEGESVDARMRERGTLAEEEVLAIADDVLAVLEAAHDKHIVHRDLKPENLFLAREVDRDGVPAAPRVKVLDFGIARVLSGASNTQVGLALGTPSYMSPEQAAGRTDEVDGRTDLFALGATMFRLLTGARIHEGSSTAETIAKMANQKAPPIRTVLATVSPNVASIVDTALKFRRDDRYPSATAMRADVRAAIEGRALHYAAAEQQKAKRSEEPTLPGVPSQPVHEVVAPLDPTVPALPSASDTPRPQPTSRNLNQSPSSLKWTQEKTGPSRSRRWTGLVIVVGALAVAGVIVWMVRGMLPSRSEATGGSAAGAPGDGGALAVSAQASQRGQPMASASVNAAPEPNGSVSDEDEDVAPAPSTSVSASASAVASAKPAAPKASGKPRRVPIHKPRPKH